MTVTIVSTHTYCGMMLIFDNKNKSVKVNMSEYLKTTISEYPEDCNKNVTCLAAAYLFDVNTNQIKLDTEKRKIFHTFVAITLCQQTRTTRHSGSDRIPVN